MKSFTRYFIQGLLITVPVAITAAIIFKIFLFVGSLLGAFGIIVNPYVDPFIVLSILIILIFLVGMLGSSIFFTSLFTVFEHLIEKAPLVKIIYSSIKDFISAFVGKKKRFNRPVLVITNREANVQQLGFITQDSLTELGIAEGKVAVYTPFSYAFSGRVIIVPKESVTPLEASAADVMKFIISGGVTEIE
ncbi:MAG TPA: DUF502 domain-containing protein [Bacteroidia bacterium]|nr:DUF502 domain-containing protein [Bacteroidia bacterium]